MCAVLCAVVGLGKRITDQAKAPWEWVDGLVVWKGDGRVGLRADDSTTCPLGGSVCCKGRWWWGWWWGRCVKVIEAALPVRSVFSGRTCRGGGRGWGGLLEGAGGLVGFRRGLPGPSLR